MHPWRSCSLSAAGKCCRLHSRSWRTGCRRVWSTSHSGTARSGSIQTSIRWPGTYICHCTMMTCILCTADCPGASDSSRNWRTESCGRSGTGTGSGMCMTCHTVCPTIRPCISGGSLRSRMLRRALRSLCGSRLSYCRCWCWRRLLSDTALRDGRWLRCGRSRIPCRRYGRTQTFRGASGLQRRIRAREESGMRYMFWGKHLTKCLKSWKTYSGGSSSLRRMHPMN